jgi:hypothetical protein
MSVTRCRKCGHAIAPGFKFGSLDTGWEHMTGECIWPEHDDPYEGYDPRDDPNHPDFEKEIE